MDDGPIKDYLAAIDQPLVEFEAKLKAGDAAAAAIFAAERIVAALDGLEHTIGVIAENFRN